MRTSLNTLECCGAIAFALSTVGLEVPTQSIFQHGANDAIIDLPNFVPKLLQRPVVPRVELLLWRRFNEYSVLKLSSTKE